jgi:phosphoribosylaminoimidazole (AIR) synthetase
MSDLSINQRLKLFLDSKDFSNQDLRVALGVKTRQQISNWLLSKEKIPDKHIFKIIDMFDDLNARWLITGEGGMTDLNEGIVIASESKSKYQICKDCIEKDGMVKLLEKQAVKKDKLILELNEKIGRLNQQLDDTVETSN